MQESTAGNAVGINLANLFVPLKIDEKSKKRERRFRGWQVNCMALQ